MDALLYKILKLKSFWVFILLEAIALTIVFNQSVFQKSLVAQYTMEISAFCTKQIDGVTSYLSLKQENEYLSKRNALLQQNLLDLQNRIDSTSHTQSYDTDTNISFISARVVSKLLNGIDNFFVVDKGKKNGVKVGLGVVSNGGVVGITQYVSDNYSLVLLALSSKINLSAMTKTSGHLCSVSWDKSLLPIGKSMNIPFHIELNRGDTIVTSTYSSVFPPQYLVGTITEVISNPNTASNDIKLRYNTDFMRVNYVDIVIIKGVEEVEALKETMK